MTTACIILENHKEYECIRQKYNMVKKGKHCHRAQTTACELGLG